MAGRHFRTSRRPGATRSQRFAFEPLESRRVLAASAYGFDHLVLDARDAGLGIDVDDIRITDLATNEVVYANTFSAGTTAGLTLVNWTDSDAAPSYDSPLSRIVEGRLRLERTGFLSARAVVDVALPENFEARFTIFKHQWAGSAWSIVVPRSAQYSKSYETMFGTGGFQTNISGGGMNEARVFIPETSVNLLTSPEPIPSMRYVQTDVRYRIVKQGTSLQMFIDDVLRAQTDSLVDVAPSNITIPDARPVPENVAAAFVGTLATADATGSSDVHTYEFVGGPGGEDNAAFRIVANGSRRELWSNMAFDFETKSSYSVRVRSTDRGGLSTERVFTVAVTDVNEPPTAVALTGAVTALPDSVSTAARVKIADVVVTDDALGTNLLSVAGADAASFEIDGGLLYLKAGTPLDAAVKSSYEVIVQVRDSGSAVGTAASLTLQITSSAIVVAAESTVSDATSRSGSFRLVKRGLGTLVLYRGNSHGGGTAVEAGGVVVRNLTALGTGLLHVGRGSNLRLDAGSANWGQGANVVRVAGLQLDPMARFEIGIGQIRVDAGGYDLGAIRAALIAGRNGGSWDGVTGFTSAFAGLGTSRTIGYRVMPNGELRLGFAAPGDVNLDGQVSQGDINLLVSGGRFGQGSSTGAGWIDGDFNYSGGVTQADVNQLVATGLFGQGGYLPLPPTHDRGDLPEPYVTLGSAGPRHAVTADLFLGARAPDGEVDGQPTSAADGDDAGVVDEDSLAAGAIECVRGQSLAASVTATNLTGRDAQITGFVDWNADGDFLDAGETFTVTVPTGSQQAVFPLPLTVPADASTTNPIALRLRLASRTSPTEPALGPGGPAPDGEVEDYLLRPAVDPMDFGDLPAPYATTRGQDGARHSVVSGLRLGGGVDVESDGIPSSSADGDDLTGPFDDEDGFSPVSVLPAPGQSVSFPVTVTNTTGAGAVLYGFSDWNDDKDFDDAGERASVNVGAVGVTVVSLPWTVPSTAVVNRKVAVRLRLVGGSRTGAQAVPVGPGGYAASGEVEDYTVYVSDGKRDYGDLPDAVSGTAPGTLGTATLPDYRTRSADNGPSHGVRPDLFLGAAKPGGGPDLDGESDGQPSASGTGDDDAGIDDETGLTLVGFQQDYAVEQQWGGGFAPARYATLDFEIPVTNLTGAIALVWAGVDFDGDGTFESLDQYGSGSVTVAGDGTQQKVSFGLSYAYQGDFATPGAFTKQVAVRVRLSTDPALSSSQAAGSLVDGEVHDEVIKLTFPAYTGTEYLYDFGDLPDAPYDTLIAGGGAWHVVVPGLAIGKKVDVEVDGVPTPHALGDDAAGSDDEDGFDPAAVVVVPGDPTTFTVNVTTPVGPGATLYGFTDWNNDGDFEDEGEETSLAVPGGLADAPVQLPVDVPTEAHVGEKLAVRLRLVGSSPTGAPQTAPLGPGGYAPSGEVEDYFIYIPDGKFDFGDLPDAAEGQPFPAGPTIDKATYTTVDPGDYWTLLKYDSTIQGPIEPGWAARHRIRPDLYLAAPGSPLPIDAETDGQPNATATGDDLNGDDEDGVTFGGISAAVVDNVTATSADAMVSVSAKVSVKNETGSMAWCSGVFFLDKDAPIDLPIGIEGVVQVPSTPGLMAVEINFGHWLHLAKPISQAELAGVFRFRVSTQDDLNGLHFPRWWLHRDGEVEDYVVDLPLDFGEWWKGTYLDYGDLTDVKYPTKLAQDGARHRFTLGQQHVFLGALAPDGDNDGKPSDHADGDDAAGPDDEDGFDPAAVPLVAGLPASFPVTVTSAAAATLVGFVDWNDDGLFTGAGETATVAVPAGSAGATVNLPWSVPGGAVTGKNLAVRLRLSTAAGLGPTGLAPDGEVEDYVVTVRPRYDFGDLPDSAPGTAPGTMSSGGTATLGDYRTRLEDDGPRHVVRDDLALRAAGDPPTDLEADGAPSADATGDDLTQADDEQTRGLTILQQSAVVLSRTTVRLTVSLGASVAVDNRTGQRAFLSGFVDATNDGDFADAGEAMQVEVPSATGYPIYSLTFTATWIVDRQTTLWTVRLPFRIRLSTQSGLGPDGLAPDGEVEDYIHTLTIDVGRLL